MNEKGVGVDDKAPGQTTSRRRRHASGRKVRLGLALLGGAKSIKEAGAGIYSPSTLHNPAGNGLTPTSSIGAAIQAAPFVNPIELKGELLRVVREVASDRNESGSTRGGVAIGGLRYLNDAGVPDKPSESTPERQALLYVKTRRNCIQMVRAGLWAATRYPERAQAMLALLEARIEALGPEIERAEAAVVRSEANPRSRYGEDMWRS